jgi:valyl-tRNA synthetase
MFSQGDIIEPLLKPQWWMDMTIPANKLIDAIINKEFMIHPENKTKILIHYLKNIQKWCLSRQTWWGNKIPAYKYWLNDKPTIKYWIIAYDKEEAFTKASNILNSTNICIEQDEDVLDTWFGSSIYPFAILGWPNETLDMSQYYPNSLLETGYDILFFWVAKIAMMSLLLLDKLPFKHVLLHGIVRDNEGEKMSKSKGNVIDPLAIINGTTLKNLND